MLGRNMREFAVILPQYIGVEAEKDFPAQLSSADTGLLMQDARLHESDRGVKHPPTSPRAPLVCVGLGESKQVSHLLLYW